MRFWTKPDVSPAYADKRMKLATFTTGGSTRIGIAGDTGVIDLAAHAPELPREMCAFLDLGDDAMARARAIGSSGTTEIPLSDLKLEAPVLRPPKILAVGLNYKDHIEEIGAKPPPFPIIFNKQSTAITGPTGAIHRPPESAQLDYEGELAFVIGTRCRRVPKDRAHEVIAGYTICNDVSVRDWQLRIRTMTMGKSWDTHCPLGPWLVTSDEIGDPHDLNLETKVNGEVRQSSNTRNLLFDCYELVEHLSTAFTLEPGDVVTTGTPSGVAIAMDPQAWLVPGDIVTITIERIGTIENTILDEPDLSYS
jgi:2-keto-4-pentenoate hydratase/2-oxohepta-3-ene-1,7-dioic acid hydratase in catechol pathway